MNKLILIVACFIIGLLIGASVFLLDDQGVSGITSEAEAAPVLSTEEPDALVVAKAKVVPVHSVKLSFPPKSTVSENVVTEVLVQEGNTVKKGTPLARLDTRDLQLRVEAAQAALAQARANNDKLRAEADTASVPAAAEAAIASAVAQIQQAEVALKREELALDLASLEAPIDGTVVEVNLNVGEVPSATQPAIVLADLSNWQIETANLTDLSIVRIDEGDPAVITFDALPGLELPGKVSHIKAIGNDIPGAPSTTYTVIITPEQQDARFRWNMTASVAITPSK